MVGCSECKRLRRKCDLAKPGCGHCVKREVQCPGYNLQYRFVDTASIPRTRKRKSPPPPTLGPSSLPPTSGPAPSDSLNVAEYLNIGCSAATSRLKSDSVESLSPAFHIDQDLLELLYTPIPPIFCLPSEIDHSLVHFYFTSTAKLMSMTELYNPFRSAIVPMLHRSPALIHVLQSMAAFQRHLLPEGIQQRKRAVKYLSSEQQVSHETILAITLLGMTESWYRDTNCGGTQFLAARALMKSFRNHDSGPGGPLNGIPRFVVNAYRYWECISAYSVDFPEEPCFMGAGGEDTTTDALDPLVGLGTDLFPQLSVIGWTIRRYCSVWCVHDDGHSMDSRHFNEIHDLERRLVNWTPPSSSSTVSQQRAMDTEWAYKMVSAYRLSGLLSLYRTHPSLASPVVVRDMARDCLGLLRQIPGDDPCQTMSMLPLFISGCEVTGDADQRFVMERLKWIESRVGLSVVTRVRELVNEVWKRGGRMYWINVMNEMGWSLSFG